MPTVVSHAAIGAGCYLAAGFGRPGARAGACAAALLAVLPDVDSLFMRWIPYGAPLGHRGLSHALAFALCLGIAAALLLRRRAAPPGGFAGLALALGAGALVHGALDALTDGGLGVAFLAPFSDARYFLPWQPIPVAPIGYHPQVFGVLAAEAWMLWPAALALATLRAPLRLPLRAAVIAALAASAVPWIASAGPGLHRG